MKEINWSKLLKVLIAVLTAIAGSIGVVSCAAKRETHPDGSQARLLGADKPNGAEAHSSGKINLPSSQATLSYRVAVATDALSHRPCEGGSTVIAENVIPCYYEIALPLRDA